MTMLVALQASPARAAPPTLEEFMAPANLIDVSISPDGERIARLHYEDGASRIRIEPATPADRTGRAEPQVIELGGLRAIWINWVKSERIAVGTAVWSDLAGSGRLPFIRVMTVSADGSDRTILFNNAREFAWNPDLSGLVHALPDDRRHILMSAGGAEGTLNLYRVDVFTGEAKLAERGRPATAVWIADGKGRPRIRIDEADGARLRRVFAKPPGAATWSQIAQYAVNDAPPLSLLAATEDPNVILLRAHGRSDKAGLYRYDLRTNRLAGRVYQRDDFDVEGPVPSPRTGIPVGTHFLAVKPEIAFFDESAQSALAAALAQLDPQSSVEDLDSDGAETRWIARVQGPDDPGSFHLIDLDAGMTRLIGQARPALAGRGLATVTTYTYRARDGLEIPAYLTVPAGTPARNLPLIVMPHGGPEARDVLSFDSLAQYIAARGYGVFQPNFRGSSGYGMAYAALGHREWGGKMQTDLIDGLDDLIAKGIADPGRVCIAGSSYGGYAALAAAMLTPKRFRCAISIAGVSDLVETIRAARAEFGERSPVYAYVERAIGRLPEDEADLVAKSPARNADRIGIPVLLAHGVADARVAIAQSIAMRDALVTAGKPVALLPMPNSTHDFFHPHDLRRLLEAMDAFLARHLQAQVSMLDSLNVPLGFTEHGARERLGSMTPSPETLQARHQLPLHLRTLSSRGPLGDTGTLRLAVSEPSESEAP